MPVVASQNLQKQWISFNGRLTPADLAALPQEALVELADQAQRLPGLFQQVFPTARGVANRELVLHELTALILRGDLGFGSTRESVIRKKLLELPTVRQATRSEQKGPSRTPIREALGILAHDGLIRSQPQVGWFVSEITPAQVREILTRRSEMEADAVATLAGQASVEARVGEAQRALAAGERATSPYEFMAADTDFHVALAEAAGFVDTPSIIRVLRNKLHLFRSSHGEITKDQAATVQQEHERILNAVLSHDRDLAVSGLDGHMVATWSRLERIAAPASDSASVKPAVREAVGAKG